MSKNGHAPCPKPNCQQALAQGEKNLMEKT